MTRSTPPIRTIRAGSIRIGDVIRVEGTIADMAITRVGEVAKRDISNMGTDFLTKSGMSLLTVFRDGSTGIGKLKISLLNESAARPVDVTLFEL